MTPRRIELCMCAFVVGLCIGFAIFYAVTPAPAGEMFLAMIFIIGLALARYLSVTADMDIEEHHAQKGGDNGEGRERQQQEAGQDAAQGTTATEVHRAVDADGGEQEASDGTSGTKVQ